MIRFIASNRTWRSQMDKALIVVDLRLFSVRVVRDLRKFLDVHWAMVLLRPTLLVGIREREQEGNVQQWQAGELLASEGLEYIVLGFYSIFWDSFRSLIIAEFNFAIFHCSASSGQPKLCFGFFSYSLFRILDLASGNA